MWLNIPHDHNPALLIIPEHAWEASDSLRLLRDALYAVDVCIWKEGHLSGGVGAGEVEGGGAALRPLIRAEDRRTSSVTEVTHEVLELIEGEEEVV